MGIPLSSAKNTFSRQHETAGFSISFKIAPSAECSCQARLTTSAFIAEYFPHSEAADEFMFAVGEALANAIEHSHSAKEISITVEIHSSTVTVTIEDNGCGFHLEKTPSGKLPQLEAERGRGLPIIFYYTDSFTIDSRLNVGTRVSLSRDL